MNAFLTEIGFQAPEAAVLVRVSARLLAAILFGAVIGFDRETGGHPAGLRTHMLVSLGAALFTVAAIEQAGDTDLGNIVKGIAAGVGFLGAGAILKVADQGEIKGLTTAAGIWLTAAVGFSCGAGWLLPAALATLLAWIILVVVRRFEFYLTSRKKD